MRVKEFFEREELKHLVEGEPEGFEPLPEVKEGAHRVQFFTDGKRWLFKASKRCKKLLALAETAARLMEEKGEVTEEELLKLFKEERDRKKMEERAKLVLRALKK